MPDLCLAGGLALAGFMAGWISARWAEHRRRIRYQGRLRKRRDPAARMVYGALGPPAAPPHQLQAWYDLPAYKRDEQS